VALFSSLNDEEMALISSEAVTYSYKRGDVIFAQGDKANHLYIVCSGKIKIKKYTVDGKEQILYILSGGDFIGAFNLLKADQFDFTAEALEDTEISTVSKSAFNEVLLKNPDITLKVLEKAYERIQKVESLVERLGTNSVDAKVAGLLLNLETNFGHKTKDGTLLTLSINREEMGSYAGIARETMTRKLKLFQELGVIKLIGTKQILIMNRDALKAMN
jgi:CRP-like cAMP-binding protein